MEIKNLLSATKRRLVEAPFGMTEIARRSHDIAAAEGEAESFNRRWLYKFMNGNIPNPGVRTVIGLNLTLDKLYREKAREDRKRKDAA